MQTAMALATMRGGLTPEEAIVAATVNAAYAAGCGDRLGVIEKGRPANLLIMNVPDYREITRQLGMNQVTTVIKDGDIVLNRGRWTIGPNDGTAGRMRSQHL
jgi:imidazolonepropionase